MLYKFDEYYITMKEGFILIAEDDADDRFLLQTAIEENGYTGRIDFVENGVDLVGYLSSIDIANGGQFPIFILLDLNMPKKDGREVLRELKQHPQFKKIPVVIFTTTRNENEVRRCYELGANTYIVKPVSFESLIKIVKEITHYWFNIALVPQS